MEKIRGKLEFGAKIIQMNIKGTLKTPKISMFLYFLRPRFHPLPVSCTKGLRPWNTFVYVVAGTSKRLVQDKSSNHQLNFKIQTETVILAQINMLCN